MGYLLGGVTQENRELMLKTPELPNGAQVRVFKDKVGGGGLLRKWTLLIGGP